MIKSLCIKDNCIKGSLDVQHSVLIGWFELSFGTQTVCLLAFQDTPNLLSPPTCIFCSSKMEHGAAGKRPASQHPVHPHIVYQLKRLECFLLGLKEQSYMQYIFEYLYVDVLPPHKVFLSDFRYQTRQ